jgi:hypothetical protein
VNIAKLQSVPRQILKTSRDAKFSRLGRLSGPAVSACRQRRIRAFTHLAL